jgi:hypothetical protein
MIEKLTRRAARSSNARRLLPALLIPLGVALAACSGDGGGNACEIEDQDGIIGGTEVFVLRVGDAGFQPVILTAQNQADVTLTLRNESSGEAGFLVDCLPTPNQDGCAQESCFEARASIAPIAPGESATVQFKLPAVEGDYRYRARAGEDTRVGQFILQ